MELVQVILSRRTVVLQHDESDCAAACLASICKYYGKRIPISTIRRLAGTDREGTSGCGIMRGAKELGFSCKGAACPDKEVRSNIMYPIKLKTVKHISEILRSVLKSFRRNALKHCGRACFLL